MPAHRHVDRRDLLDRLLHAVLADVVQAGRPRGLHRVGTVRLGDRDDRHALLVAAAPHGAIERLAHGGQSLGKLRVRHGAQVYQARQAVSTRAMAARISEGTPSSAASARDGQAS